jgi:hypothetical protein
MALANLNGKNPKCHFDYYALSALGIVIGLYLGRWPRLLHFAPLALSRLSLDTNSEVLGYFQASADADSIAKPTLS